MATAVESDEEYGEAAMKADDQGSLSSCVSFGTSKAVSNGFMDGKFVEGQKIDISQKTVSQVLVNISQVIPKKTGSAAVTVVFTLSQFTAIE